jgi:hypothetical protein
MESKTELTWNSKIGYKRDFIFRMTGKIQNIERERTEKIRDCILWCPVLIT